MPSRKERNSLKELFHDYTLRVQLSPRGIFGIADGPTLVLPTPRSGIDDEGFSIEALLSGKYTSKTIQSPKLVRADWNDISCVLRGNQLDLCVDALDSSRAFFELKYTLGRLLRSLMLQMEQPIRYQFVSFKDESGKDYRLPRKRVGSIAFYDEDFAIKSFEASVRHLNLEDEPLNRAISYFEAGCRFFDEWIDWLFRSTEFGDSEENFANTLMVTSYLQFWKAITSILEEPSKNSKKNRAFKGRVRALGIPEDERRVLGELRQIRNDFDVSHRAYDRFSQSLPRRNVRIAQHVAKQVITAYIDRLDSDKPGFGPHPLRVMRLRDRKRNPFRLVAEAPKARVGRFAVGVA